MENNPDEKLKASWDIFAEDYEKYNQKITFDLFKLTAPLLKLSTATTIVDAGSFIAIHKIISTSDSQNSFKRHIRSYGI